MSLTIFISGTARTRSLLQRGFTVITQMALELPLLSEGLTVRRIQ